MKRIVLYLLVVLTFSAAFTFGFTGPGTALSPKSDILLASWRPPPRPNDYSASRDRIISDLAQMELFGRAQETMTVTTVAEDSPLRLVAIAILDGRKYALIDQGKPLPVRLSVGEPTESGWHIVSILDEQVVLRKDDTERKLDLFTDGN